MLRARLPDLGGAAWGDAAARGGSGPARVLSPMGLVSQGFLVRGMGCAITGAAQRLVWLCLCGGPELAHEAAASPSGFHGRTLLYADYVLCAHELVQGLAG